MPVFMWNPDVESFFQWSITDLLSVKIDLLSFCALYISRCTLISLRRHLLELKRLAELPANSLQRIISNNFGC